MIYLLVFFLCLYINSIKSTKSGIRKLSIFIIYVILCFGYTTGTDWVSYELFYNDGVEDAHFVDREPGFGVLVSIFNPIISDFWIFNGLCKCFYLWSLTYMIAMFTKRVWSTIAFTLLFSSMFMIVNCPMRYMIACAFFFIGVQKSMSGKRIFAIITALIALSFHITIIIPIILFLTGVFAQKFYNIKKIVLLTISILVIILSTFSGLYSFIFSKLLALMGLEMFSDGSYAFFNASSSFNLGTLRNMILLGILIYYKNLFNSYEKGRLIFYYAIMYFWIDVLLRPIPTAFRLSIFNSQIVCVAISLLVSRTLYDKINVSYLCRYGIYAMFSFLILKSAYGSYAYYPYTNSIPYIIFGHKSYSERVNYNINVYVDTFETSGKEDSKTIDSQHID